MTNDDRTRVKELIATMAAASPVSKEWAPLTEDMVDKLEQRIQNRATSFAFLGPRCSIGRKAVSGKGLKDDEHNEAVAAVFDLLSESAEQVTDLTIMGFPGLTDLPDSVAQFSNCLKLNLLNNSLRTLPESMGEMANLRHLIIGGNEITSPPREVWASNGEAGAATAVQTYFAGLGGRGIKAASKRG